MRRIVLVILSLCVNLIVNAQADVFVWQNGQYTKIEQVDSITFGGMFEAGNFVNGHEYVDLGLPSGLKWATCNVGATSPNEFGSYYAWGETAPKDTFTVATYSWNKDTYNNLTKYNTNRHYGAIDNLKILTADDDAATVNWGVSWRTPTLEEFSELIDGCTWEWTSNYNGTNYSGQIGTSKVNGNTIFLPAAGERVSTKTDERHIKGYYWTSTLNYNGPHEAAYFTIREVGDPTWATYFRFHGYSVRAVTE